MQHAAQPTGTSGVGAATTHQKRKSSVHCSSLLARSVHAGIQWRHRAAPLAPALPLRLISPPPCLCRLPRLAPARHALCAVVTPRVLLCCGQLFTPQLPSSPVQRLNLLPLGGGAASGVRRLLQAPPYHLLQLVELALCLRAWT